MNAKELIEKIYTGIDDSLYDEEKSISLINKFALQVATDAVKEECSQSANPYLKEEFTKDVGDKILKNIKKRLDADND